ncbi:MAG: hypothetical protein LQ340_007656 [Diploschistes diacapsis]|nr:MAG: hypothetical protein LQ340_007656 [Diploschistes diacapsis]
MAEETAPAEGSTRAIAVVGGLVMDMITITARLPNQGETYISDDFTMQPGGKGANSAVAAFRLSHLKPPGWPDTETVPENAYKLPGFTGISVSMTGAVGNDTSGKSLQAALKRNHVNADKVQTIDQISSAVGIVIVERDFGENRILYYPGANEKLEAKDVCNLEGLYGGGQKPDLLITQLELKDDTVARAIKTAKEHNIDILFNPAPARFLEKSHYHGITHLIVNETEAATISCHPVEPPGPEPDWQPEPGGNWQIVTDTLLKLGVKYAVVTCGAYGAFYSDTRGQVPTHVKAEKIEQDCIIDTTGAGYARYRHVLSSQISLLTRHRDTFVGAYAVEWVKQKQQNKWNLGVAVAFANQAAAKTIQKVGCLESIPWASDLELNE